MPTIATAIFVVLAVFLIVLGYFVVGIWKTRAIASQVEKLVPQAGQIQKVPGGAIHYVDIGPPDGPVLVLIHGLGGQLQHFTYALTQRLCNDHRLIVLDRPGCGYSRRKDETYAGLSEQGAMIWACLDQLGVVNPVLVGHSLGGAVALAMAVDRPDRPRALALLAPLTHPARAPAAALAGLDISNKFIRSVLAATWAIPAAQANASATLGAVFDPDPWPEDFLVRAGGALGLRPRAFLTNVEDFRASDRTIEALSHRYKDQLKVAGGVLFGDADAILEPDEQGKPMADLGLTFETLPGHGHMLPIVCPDHCADFVRRILGETA